jgi:hypothetical protein
MNNGVPIDFRRRGQEETGAVLSREVQQAIGPCRVDAQRLERVAAIGLRTRRTRQVIGTVKRTIEEMVAAGIGDIGLDDGQATIAADMGQVSALTSKKIVDDGDLAPRGEERINEMAADEPAAACYENTQRGLRSPASPDLVC